MLTGRRGPATRSAASAAPIGVKPHRTQLDYRATERVLKPGPAATAATPPAVRDHPRAGHALALPPTVLTMNPITYECPQCHEVFTGDESLCGQPVLCAKCGCTMLVPAAATGTPVPTARLIVGPAAKPPPEASVLSPETDIFKVTPVARAFPGQILLGLGLIGLGIGLASRAETFSWPRWVALIPVVVGLLVLLLLWVKVKSCSYRLTSERLFVQRGWLARHVDELELYRVKDVVVDQGMVQRVLGYGTVTVLSDDDTTAKMRLVRISKPTSIKEMIRTHYRAARQREGVHPTELMQSPQPQSLG